MVLNGGGSVRPQTEPGQEDDAADRFGERLASEAIKRFPIIFTTLL